MRIGDVTSSADLRYVQHDSPDGDQGIRHDAVFVDATQDLWKRYHQRTQTMFELWQFKS